MIRSLVLISLLFAGCVTRIERTETLVTIDVDPTLADDVTSLHVNVFGGADGGSLTLRTEQDLGGTIAWPVVVALTPESGDASRVFVVEGIATDGSTMLGTVRARSGYVTGRTLVLRLVLEGCCRAIAGSCSMDETCRSCACVTAERPPSSLPDWSTDAGPVPGSDAPLSPDAGVPDAPDASRSDTGELDAAPDAGTDAPTRPDAPDPDTSCTTTRCYHLVRTPMVWADAHAACMSMGGDLVSILGAVEQATVWSVAAGLRTWTGGMSDGAGVWSWSDGSAWSSQWGPGEPNLPFGIVGYVSLVPGTGGLWADDQYTVAFPFICEFAL